MPPHPDLAPIPYELRVGPDGRIWMSELLGNRIVAYTPGARRFEDFILRQTETLAQLGAFLGFPLAQIPTRPDSVGRYLSDSGEHTFPFFAEDEFYDLGDAVQATPAGVR